MTVLECDECGLRGNVYPGLSRFYEAGWVHTRAVGDLQFSKAPAALKTEHHFCSGACWDTWRAREIETEETRQPPPLESGTDGG